MAASPQRCIICLNYLKAKKKLVPQHSLKEQMMIIFFLRKLAWKPIPTEDLMSFLRLGNPSEWAALCNVCEQDAKRCLDMHTEVLKIIRQITDIRKKLYDNFFEVEGEDIQEEVKVPDGCPRVRDVFIQLRHQLFSEFKEKGQATWPFDGGVIFEYKPANYEEGPTTTPSNLLHDFIIVKKENIEIDEVDGSDQDNSEPSNDNDWDNLGEEVDNEDNPTCNDEDQTWLDEASGKSKDTPSYRRRSKNSVTGGAAQTSAKRKRLCRKLNWELVKSFKNLEEARSHVKEEKTWRMVNKRVAKGGTRINYYCLHDKNCPAKIFLKQEASQTTYDLYSTTSLHDHEVAMKRGLTDHEKGRIGELLANGITRPMRILKVLRMEGIDPGYRQLTSYIGWNITRKERPLGLKLPRGRPPKVKRVTDNSMPFSTSNLDDKVPETDDVECKPICVGDGETELFESTSRLVSKEGPLSSPKKPKRQFEWVLIKKFETIEEARSHINGEKTWSMVNKMRLAEGGTKFNYYCLHDKKCSARIFLRQEASETTYDLYSTTSIHDHEVAMKQGLTDHEKSRIEEIFAKGITRPKRILTALRKEGIEPQYRQLASYISWNIRKKKRPIGLKLPRGRPPRVKRGTHNSRISSTGTCKDNSKVAEAEDVEYKPNHNWGEEETECSDGSTSVVESKERPSSLQQMKGAEVCRPRISKQPKREFEWELTKTFSTIEEAKSHVKAEKAWSYCNKRDIAEGIKLNYNCNRDRKGKCSAKIYLLIREKDNETIVDLYSTNSPHDHVPKPQLGLKDHEKVRVNELYANGVTLPRKIWTTLRDEGMAPKLLQVIAYVSYNIKRKERPQVAGEPKRTPGRPKTMEGTSGPKLKRGRPKRNKGCQGAQTNDLNDSRFLSL